MMVIEFYKYLFIHNSISIIVDGKMGTCRSLYHNFPNVIHFPSSKISIHIRNSSSSRKKKCEEKWNITEEFHKLKDTKWNDIYHLILAITYEHMYMCPRLIGMFWFMLKTIQIQILQSIGSIFFVIYMKKFLLISIYSYCIISPNNGNSQDNVLVDENRSRLINQVSPVEFSRHRKRWKVTLNTLF